MAPADKAEGKRPDEFTLIEEVFAPLAADAPGAFALKDDAALYRAGEGCETVLTVDAIVAGVHFLPDDPPESVARKLLRVNLSDLAAKGAIPKGYLLVTAWADETSLGWIRRFAGALLEDQRRYGLALWGGDTVRTTGPLTLSLTAIGEVSAGAMLPRGGALEGDDVYVSGALGDAALGLELLRGKLTGLGPEDARARPPIHPGAKALRNRFRGARRIGWPSGRSRAYLRCLWQRGANRTRQAAPVGCRQTGDREGFQPFFVRCRWR